MFWFCSRHRPVKISLGFPRLTRKGVPMPNYELANDTVATIPIQTTSSAGTVEPVPAGDVFTAVSSNPASLGAAIIAGPALQLTPLVAASPNLTVTISDSSGLAQCIQLVDIVPDVSDKNIILDVAAVTTTSQTVPTAPGP